MSVRAMKGGSACRHRTGPVSHWKFQCDGEENLNLPEDPIYCPQGCCLSPAEGRVIGGTFFLQWHLTGDYGVACKEHLEAVYITPQADLKEVAALIKKGVLELRKHERLMAE